MLPAEIERLETELEAISTAMADPAFFKQESALITAEQDKMAQYQAELETAFNRWEELEAMKQGQPT